MNQEFNSDYNPSDRIEACYNLKRDIDFTVSKSSGKWFLTKAINEEAEKTICEFFE